VQCAANNEQDENECSRSTRAVVVFSTMRSGIHAVSRAAAGPFSMSNAHRKPGLVDHAVGLNDGSDDGVAAARYWASCDA